jgi:hypothetical protein
MREAAREGRARRFSCRRARFHALWIRALLRPLLVVERLL